MSSHEEPREPLQPLGAGPLEPESALPPGHPASPYRQLVSATADQEPYVGWSGWQDLPKLTKDDVHVVLEARETDVMDELTVDPRFLRGALHLHQPDEALGSHLFVALERAAREALWHDVFVECEERDIARLADQPQATDEQRFGVGSLFRRGHR